MSDRPKRPNVLLIMSDQMTAALTGLYGHPVVKTPNLERLAERGVRFDAAYSPCPVSAPARACMMTGTYTSDNGVYDNAGLFRADDPTFAHYLSIAGYDTVVSGKTHWVGPDQLHGFKRRLTSNIYPTGFDWTLPRVYTGESFGEKLHRARGHFHAQSYVGRRADSGSWTQTLAYDEELHFRAIQYLRAKGEAKGAAEQPFLLLVSYHHPHEPFIPPKRLWELYKDEEIEIPKFPENLEECFCQMDRWLNTMHGVKRIDLRNPDNLRRLRRAYYALVTYVDEKVRELMATLEETGLARDTVVIFTSDHGDMLCEKEMVQKRTFYDWSLRVPLIVTPPGGVRAENICKEPVSLVDIAPTLLDLAGVPEEKRLPMRGESLMPLVDGTDPGGRQAFAEYHSCGVFTTCFMIRRGKYKYIYVHGHDDRLFDLEEDPEEWTNLSGDPAYADVVADLKGRILQQFDPDRINREVDDSVNRRILVREAMRANDVNWNPSPTFDSRRNALNQYLP